MGGRLAWPKPKCQTSGLKNSPGLHKAQQRAPNPLTKSMQSQHIRRLMPALTLNTCALVDASASPDAKAAAHAAIVLAGSYIADGAIVVFATETFYGLAALPTDPIAVGRLATLKGRDKDKPIALIASDIAACQAVAEMPTRLEPLAQAFWPGPLTLLLPARAQLSHPIIVPSTKGPRVGIRVSSHPVACALSRAAGGLITATSANLSGQPPIAQAAALDPALWRHADVVLDAGTLTGQAPSSVVGLASQGQMLEHVRVGAISKAALEQVWHKAQHA
jgi:L-threonylcarbamoyladenylate synthase